MKTTFALIVGLMAATSAFAGITFSNTADIAKASSNVKLYDVKYMLLASKTEVRQIPNCGGEMYPCTEVVVLERQPAVQVTVSYKDGVFHDPENIGSFVTLNLDPASFSADKVEALKAASTSVWDFGGRQFRARAAWARTNIELQNKVVTRTIQVVDVQNSHLCPIGEAGEPAPGCVEVIRYKPATTVVREISVLVK